MENDFLEGGNVEETSRKWDRAGFNRGWQAGEDC